MSYLKRHLGAVAGLVTVLLLGALLYYWRPLAILHGPLWLLVKYPNLWFWSILTGSLAASPILIVGGARQRKRLAAFNIAEAAAVKAAAETSDRRGLRFRSATEKKPTSDFLQWAVGVFIVVGLITFVPVAVMTPHLTAQSVYHHYRYVPITKLPAGGEVRIVPAEVADNAVASSYQNSGHTLANGHIVLDEKTGKLVWSFEQAPTGFVNRYFHNSTGAAQLSAEQTERGYRQFDRKMHFGPSMSISDGLNWQFRKRHYFGVPTSPVAVVTAQGEPLYLLSWVTYKGFPVKYPALGGVMVFHPNGRIEDLSPAQAAARPEIAASGRIVPEGLARDIQDAYAYKLGITNALFSHRDQTEIQDNPSSDNHMPYLMSFNEHGRKVLKWVSVAEPHGKAYAANAIFLTDAISGVTEVWRAPKDKAGDAQALTGPNRAIQLVTNQPIVGINYASQPGEQGKFAAIEPRPVFIKGHLDYLISIVGSYKPQKVVKSVIVDATKAEVIAVFNHDSDTNADKKLVAYLTDGTLDPSAAINASQIGQGIGSTPSPSSPSAPTPSAPTPSAPAVVDGPLGKQLAAAVAQAARLQAQLAQIEQQVATLEAQKRSH